MRYQTKRPLLSLLGLTVAILLAGCVAVTPTTQGTSATTAAVDTSGPAETESAQATPETVTITHVQGETPVVKNPETVVVFDYSLLDTLDQLGIPVAAVPQSNLPPFLAQYADPAYANAGTLFEPDYEQINALEPDLILVAGRSSGAYGELAKIAPTIDMTIDVANFLADFETNMRHIGLIFDRQEEIEERLAEIEASVERVRAKAADRGQNALIVLVTGGNVTAYGPGSRFGGIIHDLLGVPPVVEDIEAATHGDAISFEFILEHDPDILFVIDRDSAIGQGTVAAQQVLDNEIIHATKAWQNDKIVYLDPAIWYLANSGLRTFPQMIAEVEAALE